MKEPVTDALEDAIRSETKARTALIAIGDEMKALRDQRRQPTEEELCLHDHLIREWQRAAGAVTEQLEQAPVAPPSPQIQRARIVEQRVKEGT